MVNLKKYLEYLNEIFNNDGGCNFIVFCFLENEDIKFERAQLTGKIIIVLGIVKINDNVFQLQHTNNNNKKAHVPTLKKI